jgi:Family of unknown function (DUF5357)
MKAIIQDLRKQLTPPRWDSWQTLLLLSMFSALLGGVADPPVENIIASCGWVWLILGVWWFVYEYKKALTFGGWFAGPWIVSALFAGFLGSTFTGIPLSAVIILWAPIAAAIAILPNFIQSNKETKEPEWAKPQKSKRQGMILLLLTHLVVACWFQFYFLLQNWLAEYPSLQAESFDRSAFVINLRPDKYSRGRDVLRVAEEAMKAKLAPLDWPEVERWLLELNRTLPELQTDVQNRLSQGKLRFAEDNWWGIDGQVTGGEYDLELRARWQGPRSEADGHYIAKLCRITPQTIVIPPEQFKKPSQIKPGEIAKSLPKFRTVAKIKCEAPTEPTFVKPDENGSVGI